MSAIWILLIIGAAAASSAGQTLVCQESVQGTEPAKAFHLTFAVKGSKLNAIALEDPQAVLDPLASVPVYSPASKTGPLVLNVSEPPPRKAMKLAGRLVADGELEFLAKDPTLRLLLSEASSSDGTYTYSFEGNRLLSGIMRMGYTGQGTCRAEPAGPKEQSQ